MDDVIIRYLADTGDIEKRLSSIEKQMGLIGDEAQKSGRQTTDALKAVDDSANKSSDTFKRLGTAIIAAFAVQRVISFTKEMSNLGVQLETTAQRMRVVFGGAAKDVERESNKMAQSLGLSVNQFNLMASQVGDVLVPLGLARDQAAKMSTEAVKLAGSLSEFSAGQVDTGQAVHALIGAFTGEREALKTLGVVINEADLQARLAQKGQKNLTGQALASAKAFATFELILEKSTDAQTFFNENADSAARKQAELRAQTQTLREDLARKFLPVINSVTKSIIGFFNNIDADKLITFGKVVASVAAGIIASKIIKQVQELKIAITALTASSGIGLLVTLVGVAATAFDAFSGSVSNAEKVQERMNNIVAKERGQLEVLITKLKDTKQGTEERKRASEELNKLYPDILKNYNLETAALNEIDKAYEDIIANIEKRARVQALNEIITEETRELVRLQQQANEIKQEALNSSQQSTTFRYYRDLLNQIVEKQKEIRDLSRQISQEDAPSGSDQASEAARLARLEAEEQAKMEAERKKAAEKAAKEEAKRSEANRKKREKEEADLMNNIDEIQRKANIKMFKESTEALEAEYKIRRRIILDQTGITEADRQKQLTSLDDEYLNNRIDTYAAFAQSTVDLELQAAERRQEARMNELELLKESKEKELKITKQAEEIKRQTQLETQQALINTANIILDVGQQIADDALGLAIFQVLLNKAVAFSEAIKAALSAAAAAGPAAPVVTPLLIAQLTGLVISAFGETQSLIDNASKQRQSVKRLAKGEIMVTGDGSSTGDRIPALLSPRESVINAAATRKHYQELLAINTGTFDRLVNSKYVIPAINKYAKSNPNIVVDAGFNDDRIYNSLKRANTEGKRQHNEMMRALNKPNRRRKDWY